MYTSAVTLSNVSKHYTQQLRTGGVKDTVRNWLHPQKRRIDALTDVTLEIAPGEFVAYAGPNGAGKSTTIKLLSGMLTQNAGDVRVLGLSPTRQRIPLMRRLGVLMGNRSELWWDHPVQASFDWKRDVWNIEPRKYAETRDKLIDALELAPLLKTFARELSLGQRMRADLALMLLHGPELVLLDEPTLGLDVVAKRSLIGFLKALNRENGVTVVVTSHDMDDLEEMARRIVLISEGKIAFDGDFARLRESIGERRLLKLTTAAVDAPAMRSAEWLESREGSHVYAFGGGSEAVSRVLAEVAGVKGVLDVELTRPPLEQMMADLFTRWNNGHRC